MDTPKPTVDEQMSTFAKMTMRNKTVLEKETKVAQTEHMRKGDELQSSFAKMTMRNKTVLEKETKVAQTEHMRQGSELQIDSITKRHKLRPPSDFNRPATSPLPCNMSDRPATSPLPSNMSDSGEVVDVMATCPTVVQNSTNTSPLFKLIWSRIGSRV